MEEQIIIDAQEFLHSVPAFLGAYVRLLPCFGDALRTGSCPFHCSPTPLLSSSLLGELATTFETVTIAHFTRFPVDTDGPGSYRALLSPLL
jgi:hypothetical protein